MLAAPYLRSVLSLALFGLGAALASGCTVDNRRLAIPDAGPPADDASGTVDTAFVHPDIGPLPDSGGPLADVVIYAHSSGTLFHFSPFTNTVTSVGRFTVSGANADPMVDLAVDSAGNVVTASATTLWSVDPDTAVVTSIGDFDVTAGEQFYALTFLARGDLHPDREALIGATNMGAYYEIDAATAHTSFLGQYPDGWLSSGDLVSVQGLATYATIRHDGDTHDTLAQITFASDGTSVITVIGPVVQGATEYNQIFGLGYWGRSVYGFTNHGELIEIDRMTGAAHLATTMTGTGQFWGAGVTTVAPILI